MRKKYEVEALLRPPVELYSSLVMMLVAAITAASPSLFMMPKNVGLAVASIIAVLGLIRLRQGIKVIRYQKGLKKAPKFVMSRSQIPVNRKMLYLGRGFLWGGKHTQRVHDAREDDSERYVKPSRLVRWIRRKEIEWDESRWMRWVCSFTSWDSILNPLRPLPPIGGEPMLHGVGVDEEVPTYLSLKERAGHLIVKGSTGVGKTTLAILLLTQDIRRKNNCVITLDPKGSADLLLTTCIEAIRSNRKFYIFHLGFPEVSAKYSAIGNFTRITEVPSRISSPLPSDGDAAAFREFVWQFVNVIAVALTNLGEKVDYESVKKYMRQIDPLLVRYGEHWLTKRIPGWKETFDEKKSRITSNSLNGTNFKSREKEAVAMYHTLMEYKVEDSIIAGLLHAFQFEKTYFDKLTNAVGPFLEKLTTGRIAQILSPKYDDIADVRPVIDWEEVLRQEAVVYVGLDALTDPEVASAVGSSMFSDLTSLAGRKTKFGITPGLPEIGEVRNPDVIIHGDEFNDLIGPHMVTLLNKSRSADYQLNLYTQTWSDVEAKLGSAAKAGQIAGNLNTEIMMRVKEKKTADMLTEQLPEINVNTIMAVSGVDDGNPGGDGKIGFKSRNEDRISSVRVPLLTSSDIVGLPIGHAFAILSGSHPHKIRIPILESPVSDESMVPDFVRQMVVSMRSRYISKEGWNHFSDSVDLTQLSVVQDG